MPHMSLKYYLKKNLKKKIVKPQIYQFFGNMVLGTLINCGTRLYVALIDYEKAFDKVS